MNRAAAWALVVTAVGVLSCSPPAPEPRLLRIAGHEFAFTMPDTIPAGLVRVRFVNDGGFWHHALFAKLDSTQTAEGYLAAIRAGADFPPGAVDHGGPPLTVPGDSVDHVMTFTPGRWVALCTASGGGVWHVAAGMCKGFVVTAQPPGRAAIPPMHDLELIMNDTGFVFPNTVRPGTRWVRIENRGRRWHECDILRFVPGKGFADDRAWRPVEHLGTPAPGRPVGGTADFIPGDVQWSRVRFEPGVHELVCEMPGDSTHHRTFWVGGTP